MGDGLLLLMLMFWDKFGHFITIELGAGLGHGGGGHGCVCVSDGHKCGVDGVRLELGRHVTVRQGPVGQCPRNKTKPVVGEVLSEVVWVVVMVDSNKEQITHTFTRSFVFILAPLNLLPEKKHSEYSIAWNMIHLLPDSC